MNEYKITYRTVEGNAQRFIVERTEAAARKQLKADVEGAEITDVELVDDNANATKAQERATLAKIKAMVAELGPQSYIATAFEGCFEIAEENIDDDAAYSGQSSIRATSASSSRESRSSRRQSRPTSSAWRTGSTSTSPSRGSSPPRSRATSPGSRSRRTRWSSSRPGPATWRRGASVSWTAPSPTSSASWTSAARASSRSRSSRRRRAS